jgi:putative spermidine/putrescine transport system ATP-binding protein
MNTSSEFSVQLKDVTIGYGDNDVIAGLDLDIRRGEILSLLGPSGCGKTTTLHAIAGLITPRKGSVLIDGVDQTHVPINRRNVGMVFQGYALFPHMTVFNNVAYGLRIRSVAKSEVRDRVGCALKLVGMEKFIHRRPKELSGGQQQRVAIARTIVVEPKVLLLDEPLSNLDAKLRHDIRGDLKRILKELSITSVFVTHDQEEAMFLSDRIVLMKDGMIAQLAEPPGIYNHPANSFVAEFLGNTNFIAGNLSKQSPGDRMCEVTTKGAGKVLRGFSERPLQQGQAVNLAVRHDCIGYSLAEADFHALQAREDVSVMACRIGDVHFLGMSTRIECVAGDQVMTVLHPSSEITEELQAGADIFLYWPHQQSRVLPL